MLESLIVYSREQLVNASLRLPPGPWAGDAEGAQVGGILSIRDNREPYPAAHEGLPFDHFLTRFEDVQAGPGAATIEHAREVIEWLAPLVEDEGRWGVIVSCEAGMSRSVGVAQALSLRFNAPLFLPPQAAGGMLANETVRTRILEALDELYPYDEDRDELFFPPRGIYQSY